MVNHEHVEDRFGRDARPGPPALKLIQEGHIARIGYPLSKLFGRS
jgi:hypothetical protein